MAEKILIASGKGGVGKSTIASFLARESAQKGNKVLLIDADPGLGALDILLGVSDRVMNTWIDIVTENCDGENALIEVAENLSLLPSPSVYPEDVTAEDFRSVVAYFDDKFDMIFIDAAKGQYNNYFNDIISKLKTGGILISDNVLQDGDIVNSRYAVTRRNRTIHSRMREYLYMITHNDMVDTIVLPVGDGVTISIKK